MDHLCKRACESDLSTGLTAAPSALRPCLHCIVSQSSSVSRMVLGGSNMLVRHCFAVYLDGPWMVLGGSKLLAMCIPRIYHVGMTTTLQAWGNSQGVRIPKALLNALQLKTGMRLQVELSPKKDSIIVKPSQETVTIRGRHKIEDLVSKMPRSYKSQEFFSQPSGREVW